MNYFIVTFYIFKLFTAFCFAGTVYFIGKILKKVLPKYEVMGMLLYALNPLVLIESLVSAHNDVAMVFLAIAGVYFLIQKKWLWGLLLVILSALTKQAMVFLLLPAILYAGMLAFKKEVISQKVFLLSCLFIMIAGYIVVITRIEIQPWYTLWFLPFIVLIKPNKYFIWLVVGFCLGVLLRYVPFLWQGDWNGMANTIKFYVTIITPVIFILIGGLFSLVKSYVKK